MQRDICAYFFRPEEIARKTIRGEIIIHTKGVSIVIQNKILNYPDESGILDGNSVCFIYVYSHRIPHAPATGSNHSRLGNCTAYTSKMVENFPVRDENEVPLPEVIIQCIRWTELNGVVYTRAFFFYFYIFLCICHA